MQKYRMGLINRKAKERHLLILPGIKKILRELKEKYRWVYPGEFCNDSEVVNFAIFYLAKNFSGDLIEKYENENY